MKRLLRKLQYGDDCVDLEEFVMNSYNKQCFIILKRCTFIYIIMFRVLFVCQKKSKCFATRYYAYTCTCTCFWELLKK